MADIQPGYTYGDAPNNVINAQNLNEHVANATILPAFISAKTLKNPAALSDKHVIEDGGVLKYITNQQIHDLILYPGCVVQTVYGYYDTYANLGVIVIPADNTVPENTEGTQIISLSITPRFATSTILCKFDGQWGTANPDWGTCALFRDSGLSAIAAQGVFNATIGGGENWVLAHMDSPATISPIAYKIRVGSTVSALFLNGNSGSGLFAGISKSTLVLQEIKV